MRSDEGLEKETDLAVLQDMGKLGLLLDSANDIITKDYLYKLEEYELAEMPEELQNIDIAEYTRIYKFTRIVSDKKESVSDKMVTVLNAMYSSNATVITLIRGHKSHVEYYLGVVSKDIRQEKESIMTQGATLEGSLIGNFPGMTIEPIRGMAKKSLLEDLFRCDHITAVSGIASMRDEKNNKYEKYVQGIEHLVDALQGREYSVVIVADSVNAQEIAAAKYGYEELYTQLFPFLKSSISFNESESITLNKSHTEGLTKTIGESISLTQNYSKTSGWNTSESVGKDRHKNQGAFIGQAVGTLTGAGLGALAAVLTGGAGAPFIAAGANLGAGAGGMIGGAFIGASGTNENHATGENANIASASGTNKGKNTAEARMSNDTIGEAEGTTHGKSIQLSHENRTIKNILAQIDKHLERLKKCEAYGAFNCAAYVITPDPETNAIVASSYNALMRGDNSALQSSYINNWNAEEKNGKKVKEYLLKLSHPLFVSPNGDGILLNPASLSNSYELAVNVGLPRKSIPGLPVFEMAAFGRNVLETNAAGKPQEKIELGSVYHMGAGQGVSVGLNLKSLAMHTFITGSTGSGKSNTVYQILRELKQKGVRYLVIEPAKGEYKHVFGNTGANVYGTNPYVSPLLKVNPFKFPEGIHVLEHIDRLIEIFNVCWPMYAAMPAVLKDSVERAYTDAGWDLVTSKNRYSGELFPTFADVLAELNLVVGESAFSQEVKDNYTGSLATRIKSLTNGIYGRIFDHDELGDEKLFDEDVIIDLSRVGSVETKAMIMGILIMRLQEYRMTSGDMDADLKHVTVLEEAHNILKRTSTEQSSESSNLLGKSVEMLSNAIAEVRTYGEGFIIADQAPGLLDMSVIRNTNTKIIMRLPDAEDRNLVGKSANLSEEQIKELSKLPTGIAAAYQNNWLEPVLCQVSYEKSEGRYENCPQQENMRKDYRKFIISRLLAKEAGERFDSNMPGMIEKILRLPLPTSLKGEAIRLLKENVVGLKDMSRIIYDLVCTPELERTVENASSIEEWREAFVEGADAAIGDLKEEEQNRIIECVLLEQIERFNRSDECLENWYQYLRGEVM